MCGEWLCNLPKLWSALGHHWPQHDSETCWRQEWTLLRGLFFPSEQLLHLVLHPFLNCMHDDKRNWRHPNTSWMWDWKRAIIVDVKSCQENLLIEADFSSIKVVCHADLLLLWQWDTSWSLRFGRHLTVPCAWAISIISDELLWPEMKIYVCHQYVFALEHDILWGGCERASWSCDGMWRASCKPPHTATIPDVAAPLKRIFGLGVCLWNGVFWWVVAGCVSCRPLRQKKEAQASSQNWLAQLDSLNAEPRMCCLSTFQPLDGLTASMHSTSVSPETLTW